MARYSASAWTMTNQTRLNWENWPATCEPNSACIAWNTSPTCTPSTSALLRSRSTNSCWLLARKVVLTPCSSGRCRALARNALTAASVARGSPRAAVLDVELESAGRAQAGDRGRVDARRRCRRAAPANWAFSRLSVSNDSSFAILALVEGLQQPEHDRGAVVLLAVDEAVAVDRADVLHRRVLEQDLLQLRGEPAGHLQAGRVLHLRDDEEVALVLVRHEARRAGCGT